MRPLLVSASWNEAITEVWAGGAVGIPVSIVVGAGGDAAGLPDVEPVEVLRIVWLEFGSQTPTPGDVLGVVQLSIFVPDRRYADALERAAGLDRGIGLAESDSQPRMQIFDHTASPALLVGHAYVSPLEPTWLAVIDPTPGVVHLARTFELTLTP